MTDFAYGFLWGAACMALLCVGVWLVLRMCRRERQ